MSGSLEIKVITLTSEDGGVILFGRILVSWAKDAKYDRLKLGIECLVKKSQIRWLLWEVLKLGRSDKDEYEIGALFSMRRWVLKTCVEDEKTFGGKQTK